MHTPPTLRGTMTGMILMAAACLMLLPGGCERADRDEELIRVDAAPHANAVNQAKQDWGWISGTDWVVTSIEGAKPIEGTELWIRFEDHRWMSGSSGCNRLSASYERRGIDGLKVSQVASTKMYCSQPEGRMQQESRFLYLLGGIDSYHAEADTLTLSTNAIGLLTFKRVEEADD